MSRGTSSLPAPLLSEPLPREASLGLHISSFCPLDSVPTLPCLLVLLQGPLPCPHLPWPVRSVYASGQQPPLALSTLFSMQQPQRAHIVVPAGISACFPHSARSCCGFPFSLVHSSFATPGLMLLLLLFLQEAPEDSPPLSSGVLWHLGVAHCLFFLCKVGFGVCRVAPACVRGRCSPAEMLGVCGPAEGLGVCLHSAPPSMKSVTSCPPRPSIPRAAPWCRRPIHCWESGR